jgi:dihydroorotase
MTDAKSLRIINARFIDAFRQLDTQDTGMQIRVEGGSIADVGETLEPQRGEEVVDLQGAVLTLAGCDPHVHLREPGGEQKETLETGCRAAAAGGFTEVACMPNTTPALDEAFRVRGVRERANEIGLCRVHVIGAITCGLAGQQLTDMTALRDAGAPAFSDDGLPVTDSVLMRRALEWARPLGVRIITHAEDRSLRGRGVMNEGETSGRLGLAGIPAASESMAVARDLELAELTGAPLHIAHVSTARSIDLVRDAKNRGVPVSAETAPHYLFFTDRDVEEMGTAAKMNPPLRTADDRAALRSALLDGTIDCIATDHAPHTVSEKDAPFAEAPFGVVGLETSLAALITALHHEEGSPLVDVLRLWNVHPRFLLNGTVHSLLRGAPADLVAFDPDAEWTVQPSAFHSKGRHTPFAGSRLRGRILFTWFGGRQTFARPRSEAGDGESAGRISPAISDETELTPVGEGR